MSEISDAIEQDLRSLDEILKELNKEAAKHKAERDRYHQQADVLAEKRDKLQEKAKRLSSEARSLKAQRDDYNLTASEMRQKRDEWNDKARTMRERGGLGDISGAKQMADTYHQKMVKANDSGQLIHEKMHQLFEDADKLRAEAQVCHEQYLDCKKAADAEHEKFIQVVKRINNVKDNLPD
ncbi:MAG: hypothetical protein IJ592_01055 [Candidatus Methanomethylophilaceae archaeon]|nr:hypothetical protein [Candidatus Methanomethylophilaceae archaeon]